MSELKTMGVAALLFIGCGLALVGLEWVLRTAQANTGGAAGLVATLVVGGYLFGKLRRPPPPPTAR